MDSKRSLGEELLQILAGDEGTKQPKTVTIHIGVNYDHTKCGEVGDDAGLAG